MQVVGHEDDSEFLASATLNMFRPFKLSISLVEKVYPPTQGIIFWSHLEDPFLKMRLWVPG